MESLASAFERFHAWWMTPGPSSYGPGVFDFEPDWGLTIAKAWLRAEFRRIVRQR